MSSATGVHPQCAVDKMKAAADLKKRNAAQKRREQEEAQKSIKDKHSKLTDDLAEETKRQNQFPKQAVEAQAKQSALQMEFKQHTLIAPVIIAPSNEKNMTTAPPTSWLALAIFLRVSWGSWRLHCI